MSSGVSFKKLSVKNKGARKRKQSSSSSDSGSDQESAVVRGGTRATKSNPNIHKSSAIKSQKVERKQESNSEDEDAAIVSYRSNRSAMPLGPSDQGATATVEIDTEKDRDAQTIFEKSQEINDELRGKADDKIYRGLNNYTQFYKKKDTAMENPVSL